jgi:hypothetical protein
MRDQGRPDALTLAEDHVDHARGEDPGEVRRELERGERVCSEGFSTTALPAASAGASFHAAIISG